MNFKKLFVLQMTIVGILFSSITFSAPIDWNAVNTNCALSAAKVVAKFGDKVHAIEFKIDPASDLPRRIFHVDSFADVKGLVSQSDIFGFSLALDPIEKPGSVELSLNTKIRFRTDTATLLHHLARYFMKTSPGNSRFSRLNGNPDLLTSISLTADPEFLRAHSLIKLQPESVLAKYWHIDELQKELKAADPSNEKNIADLKARIAALSATDINIVRAADGSFSGIELINPNSAIPVIDGLQIRNYGLRILNGSIEVAFTLETSGGTFVQLYDQQVPSAEVILQAMADAANPRHAEVMGDFEQSASRAVKALLQFIPNTASPDDYNPFKD